MSHFVFFFQAEDGIRDLTVTGVQTCALPIYPDQHAGGPPHERFAEDEHPTHHHDHDPAHDNSPEAIRDRKSTRLNSSHSQISYAVFCLKKKKRQEDDLYGQSARGITIAKHHT